MSEILIELEDINLLDFFGAREMNLERLKEEYPDLRIIARGEALKAIGSRDRLADLQEKVTLMRLHLDRFGSIGTRDMDLIFESVDESDYEKKEDQSDVLLHGRDGRLIRAKTPNQARMVDKCKRNDLVFAIGPAGTGKTYTAVALAIRALKNKEVRRIILTRPAVEAGENLGFLPGDLRDKLDPYLQPLYDALRDMLPHQKLLSYFEDGTIEIAPLAFMRGRTLDHAFVILDEAQNASISQIKMFLTRMGNAAKFIVTGDVTQVDLPRGQASGLIHARDILKDIKGVSFAILDEKDIIRHPLVGKIINAYEKDKPNN